MGHFDQITLHTVPGLPEIHVGDDLAGQILDALRRMEWTPEAGDILVIAHKVVSKAEGRVLALADVIPSPAALELAKETGKPAAKVECILRESRRILKIKPPQAGRESVIICEHRLGLIMANAGIDESNVPGEDRVVLLPENPDRSAAQIRSAIRQHYPDAAVGIILSDTFGRPWRMGLVNVAIGLAGVPGIISLAGETDAQGRILRATIPAFADEVAAAAGLLMEKAGSTPVILVRGLTWPESEDGLASLLRPEQDDLFR